MGVLTRTWARLPDKINVSPDGWHYLAVARKEPEPHPFCNRWFIPRLCGEDARKWHASTRIGLAAYILAVGVLALEHGATLTGAVAASLLVGVLPGTLVYLRMPLLVDPPMLALSTWCAVALHYGWWGVPFAIPLAVLAGMVRETGPIWAAVFAFNPLPLVGMIPVALTARKHRDAGNVGNPPSLNYHRQAFRDPWAMVLPWGGLIVSVLWMSPWLALALAVGYGQLFVASDRVRLYQQAAPVLAVTVVTHSPALGLLVLASWVNPWRGDGV